MRRNMKIPIVEDSDIAILQAANIVLQGKTDVIGEGEFVASAPQTPDDVAGLAVNFGDFAEMAMG
jgi:hypothetical protein